MYQEFIRTLIVLILFTVSVFAQRIPASYSGIQRGADGKLILKTEQVTYPERISKSFYGLQNMIGNPQGTENGLRFDFNDPEFTGLMYYGFIPYGDSKHPQPVFFKRTSKIKNGKATIKIKKKMAGKYDMIGWEAGGKGTIGYRIADTNGRMIYEGRISFKGTGPFEVDDTIVEGPFVNLLHSRGATISLTTNRALIAKVKINGQVFKDASPVFYHEIKISGLTADQVYKYSVYIGANSQTYSLHTAPVAGARKPFTFAYASDSRGGSGGGERNFFGPNVYMIKKIMALTGFKNSAFMQFTGDLISGYRNHKEEMNLQYANWKRAIEPYAHYLPAIATMGNHEALIHSFNDGNSYGYSVDRFPFVTESAEAVFAANFVNPLNGPESEDGAVYDPDKSAVDFPSYKENAFYYTYDNVAMVVMNSNYWYAPSLKHHPETSGNLHGYIMDKQLQWLKETLAKLEQDTNIDHIFVTEHTPFFPNGGHSGDDMWYGGNNKHRAVVAGKPVEKGIIERRDQLLDMIVNKSAKVRAILTGDEHNYCRMAVGPQTVIYPENYEGPKLKLTRTIWQINNGSAGAPYYAQEKLPWSDMVKGFTTQNVVVYFHVNGKEIKVEVQNPDTLEPVDEMELTSQK